MWSNRGNIPQTGKAYTQTYGFFSGIDQTKLFIYGWSPRSKILLHKNVLHKYMQFWDQITLDYD